MRPFTTHVRLLTNHAVKRRIREGSGLSLVLGLSARWLLYALLLSIGFAAGRHADVLLDAAAIDGSAANLIERHLLHGLLSLLAITVLSPTRNALDCSSYRFFPISRFVIAAVSVALQIVRLPLALYSSVTFGLYLGVSLSVGSWGAAAWLSAMIGLGVFATLVGHQLRHVLLVRPRLFYGVAGALTLSVADVLVTGSDVLAGSSAALSHAILDGSAWPPLLIGCTAAAAFLTFVHSVAERLRYLDPMPSARHRTTSRLNVPTNKSPTFRLVVLELQMLRRCSYPRYQIRGIGLLLAVLLLLAALTPDDAYRFVSILFVVAGISATYGQLAFAWNSEHFDGLFALPIRAADHVRARWLVCALLAAIASAVMLLFMMVLGIRGVWMVGACFLFTMGAVIAPLIWTSVRWSRPVSLEGSGIGNLKAYSWHLYVLIFGLWGGSRFLLAMTSPQITAAAFLAVGVLGLLLQPIAVRHLAVELNTSRPALAERFRA